MLVKMCFALGNLVFYDPSTIVGEHMRSTKQFEVMGLAKAVVSQTTGIRNEECIEHGNRFSTCGAQLLLVTIFSL